LLEILAEADAAAIGGRSRSGYRLLSSSWRNAIERPRHCEERSDEAIQGRLRGSGLLRGACHRAALRADPLARNDGEKQKSGACCAAF